MKPTSKFSLVYTTENELGFTTSESSDNTPNTSPRSVRQLPVWGKRHAQVGGVRDVSVVLSTRAQIYLTTVLTTPNSRPCTIDGTGATYEAVALPRALELRLLQLWRLVCLPTRHALELPRRLRPHIVHTPWKEQEQRRDRWPLLADYEHAGRHGPAGQPRHARY